jgi:hypothetical protein
MGYEHNLANLSLVAKSDLRALQFTFVKVLLGGEVEANTTSGGYVIGVLQNKPNVGETAEVAFGGVTKIVLGATVGPAAEVMSDASGRAIAAPGGSAPGDFVRGQLLEGGDADEIGTMCLAPTGYKISGA